jgi:hypothetical protein
MQRNNNQVFCTVFLHDDGKTKTKLSCRANKHESNHIKACMDVQHCIDVKQSICPNKRVFIRAHIVHQKENDTLKGQACRLELTRKILT